MIAPASQSLMEVTNSLSSCARSADFDFGADTALVAVQHMLYQTVDLFGAMAKIGLRPDNIFALGKVYSNSASVIAAIRNMGATVLESTFPRPGEFDATFEHDVHRLWETVAKALAHRRIKRIIVLDDGGKCIINIPPELLSRYPVAGVEQTSLGMFVFEETPPPFAVFSWARAAVKLQFGGHIFSQCLVDRVATEFLRGKSLTRAEIGIIGLGSIGRGLADIVLRQGNKIVFYDPAGDLNVPHYLRDSIARTETLEDLMMRCDYLFGASGRNPFRDRWPMQHRPGIKLFSGSGGDQEFGPIIRSLRGGPSFSVDQDTWDITSDDGPSGPIRIAYLGFPYNFVSRAEAAVPTHIVQIETGGLLAALIEARTYLTLVEDGYAPDAHIHRVSPEAQRFVYQRWLRAMNSRGVDIRELYGYDSSVLAAAQGLEFFVRNSEPRWNVDGRLEEMMKSILRECYQPSP